MRSIVLINRLILGSIIMASSCVSGSVDDEPAIGPTEGGPIGADEVRFDGAPAGGAVNAVGSMVIVEEPHELSEEQLDSNGQLKTEMLSCGLSILVFSDYTDYWIRNCFEHEIIGQVITLYDDELYISEDHAILAFATVSGSVRGRVLRLRRR